MRYNTRMKIINETFRSASGRTADEDWLFFDIESTGLSPRAASVYLIGCSWYERAEDLWRLRLYFADSRRSEPEVLGAFADLLAGFSCVTHFNGDHFDIPFLKYRYAKYGMDDPFKGKDSVDLLKRVRKYKKLLGVENLKQKTLERYLGVGRKDTFGGGELIRVYEEYLYTDDPGLEHFLLLHNLEDVKGMSELTALLDIPGWIDGGFYLNRSSECGRDMIRIDLLSETEFPGHTELAGEDGCALAAGGRELSLKVRSYGGKVRIWYDEPGQYWFLPDEGIAVHKSVSAWTDPSRRVRATKDNCFGLCSPEALVSCENATLFAHSWLKRFMK